LPRQPPAAKGSGDRKIQNLSILSDRKRNDVSRESGIGLVFDYQKDSRLRVQQPSK
jgi:hypothetical protein